MDGKNVASFLKASRPCAAIPLLLFLFVFCSVALSQQRQLIILKNEEVLARYQKGDAIHFARAQDKEIQIQRILDLNDTLLMMNLDSVAYYRIVKLDLRERKQTTYAQKLGAIMMVAGVILPLAELFNTGVIQEGEDASVSSGVWAASAGLIGGGAALFFIKKPYFKPGRKYKMIIVDDQSPFYKTKPATEGYISPYIPKN